MRTGVFLCTCGRTIDIDFKKLGKSIGADFVEIHDLLCQETAKTTECFKRNKLDRALVACTSRRQVFEELGQHLQFVNLREHCGWVHDRKEATEKAGLLINAALRYPPSVRKTVVEVGNDVLITGELSSALKIALYLSKAGGCVHVLSAKTSSIEEVFQVIPCGVKLHKGKLKSIEGRIGAFSVNITGNPIDAEKCISCGKCLEACPVRAIRSYQAFTVCEECNSCGKCIDICPVQAIDFNDDTLTIKAGQVLAIGGFSEVAGHQVQSKKGIYVTKAGKNTTETLGLALPSTMRIMANIGSIEQDRLLAVALDGCAAGKSGIAGCKLCESVCEHGAITRIGDKIKFDEISCIGCGACASICPLSLPGMKDDIYSKMEYLLSKSHLSPGILMFTCGGCMPLLDAAGRNKIKYHAVLPLFVPHIAGISEAHILRAFDLGADGVILLGCGKCIQGNEEALRLAGLMLKEFGLDTRLKVIIGDDGIESFVKSAASFSSNLTPGPLRKHELVALKNTSKRRIMLDLLSGFAARTGITPSTIIEDAEFPFASISINSKCTVCGACTSMCPAGALKRENGIIRFIYGYCIACGLCEKACPEEALKMRRVLDLAKLIEAGPETVFESELMTCALCRKPYMTTAAFDRIAGSLITNIRDDIQPQEQVELIRSQIELLKFCEECRPSRAIQKMGLFS